MPGTGREPDDFRLLIEGEISSEEYVRRLQARVRADHARYYPRHTLPGPEEAARRGFWDGVRSVFRFGR